MTIRGVLGHSEYHFQSSRAALRRELNVSISGHRESLRPDRRWIEVEGRIPEELCFEMDSGIGRTLGLMPSQVSALGL